MAGTAHGEGEPPSPRIFCACGVDHPGRPGDRAGDRPIEAVRDVAVFTSLAGRRSLRAPLLAWPSPVAVRRPSEALRRRQGGVPFAGLALGLILGPPAQRRRGLAGEGVALKGEGEAGTEVRLLGQLGVDTDLRLPGEPFESRALGGERCME